MREYRGVKPILAGFLVIPLGLSFSFQGKPYLCFAQEPLAVHSIMETQGEPDVRWGLMAGSGGVEFLFDDQWIDRKSGVRRVTGTFVKQSGPVLKKEKRWEPLTTDENLGVLYDEQEHKFKIWYKATTAGKSKPGTGASPPYVK